MPARAVNMQSPARYPILRGVLRAVVWSLTMFLLLAAGISVWLYSIATSALPRLDGTVPVKGITEKVRVVRDQHGLPTITASNLDDLLFAQGYVTAQDRLWQMDGMRRFAAGDLSEIFGDDLLKLDRRQRILGIRAAAQHIAELQSPEERSRFEAYVGGVNAFIESHRSNLPIEFRILRYAPKPWTVVDSASIAAMMIEDLSASPYHALTREKILAKLGPQLTADLYVNSSWHDHPPTVTRPGMGQDRLPSNEDEQDDSGPDSSVTGLRFIDRLPWSQMPAGERDDFHVGSNNWVVSGEHTESGKPLLSNDMHLGHRMPNLWYATHLRCGSFDVEGVSLPGYPYVIAGHNRRVAWGFTNIGPTVEDAYIESFDSGGRYLAPEGWRAPQLRHEVIKVKGKPDVAVDVQVTRHGPIVTDLIPGETRKIALRWTLYDGPRNVFFDVDSAENWEQFRQAFSRFDAPAQNVVYADVDGNIGYQATGKIPIRASGDGSLPENGSDNAHEWIAYIPYEKLPSILNPPSGIAATANSRITPDAFPYTMSVEWEAPWRTARIYRVLESGKRFSSADMLGLETDVYSEFDRFVAERLVYAVDHAGNASARAKAAAEIMREWDGQMRRASAAATIESRTRSELVRLLLEPKLGPAAKDPKADESTLSWKSYRWMMSTIWLENVLQHQPSRWLPATYANYNELLASAVQAAVTAPDAPADLNSWRWGKLHPIDIQHPILGKVPLLKWWTGTGPHEQSGSTLTVKAVAEDHGPSERMTVDLSNLDESTLNLVTGEAGNFLSPYYMDEWTAWYEGFTFKLPFSESSVTAARAHELELQPDLGALGSLHHW